MPDADAPSRDDEHREDGRVRYAQVGLGLRSWLYSAALAHRFADHCALVALCDHNAGRLAQRRDWARQVGLDVPAYDGDELERMLAECRPDRVIVTTPDADHDRVICAAMEAGADVVTEKPLTIDAERCRRILETSARTGRRCLVTFNYRYSPPRTQVKALLDGGLVGEIHSVEFQWQLDTTHGADYFRRWHRRKEVSGGLLVHKATHHFDLVNWWLGRRPLRVHAAGSRRFYTPERADAYGLRQRGARCLDCREAERCRFHLDLRNEPLLKSLYLDHEGHDGYHRDACVFSDAIDIEDAASVVVEYEGGAHLAYSLNASSPWEGYDIAFNGTLGRLEHRCRESVYVSGDGSTPGRMDRDETTLTWRPHFEPAAPLEVWTAEGGHGGGDERLVADLLAPTPGDDPHGCRADVWAGARSIAVGIAANRSIATGAPVAIADLIPELAD